jgi:asparagine synthase (glutamine-hydrolysing)
MCGIIGLLDFRPSPAAGQHLAAMAAQIRHRGPDGEGYTLFNWQTGALWEARGPDTPPDLNHLPALSEVAGQAAQVALGHRRLAILDLSPKGHNPMPYGGGRYWITYNGEIYNYLELRAELAALGYEFRSEGDTEVLLAAYQHWGPDCLSRLNGMFAFALWDVGEKRLFCARDRFGIKPFYYAQAAGQFIFASEIKALLAHPDLARRPDEAAIMDYLANGSISHQNTFFGGIQSLPASQALLLDSAGALKIWPYYQLSYQTHFEGGDYAEEVAAFRDVFTDAVRIHLRSDVPIGTALSGGLDSSSVVTTANHLLQGEHGVKPEVIGERQKVFCAIYEGEAFNEQAHMQTVISQTGAAAFFARPDSGQLWAALPKLVWHQDEPFNSTAIFAQYCVMQTARQAGVTVLLDGQGADEILAGYPFYYGYFVAQAFKGGYWGRAWSESRAAHCSPSDLGALTAWNLAPAWLRRWAWAGGAKRWLSNQPLPTKYLRGPVREGQLKHHAQPSLADKLYQDVFQTSLPLLLRYEDRNSMAFHLEARVPFLDYRVVEQAFQVSARAHIRGGWTKALLRDAMAETLPPSIRWRKDKEGYTTPHERWLRELAPQIRGLFESECRAAPYLSGEGRAILRSAEVATMPGLWRVLNLELWLRAFDLGR